MQLKEGIGLAESAHLKGKCDIVVNMSRIGKCGTGMFEFSKNIIHCLKPYPGRLAVLTSLKDEFAQELDVIPVPAYIAAISKVSKIRPILWLLYMSTLFRNINACTISTTHHPVPGAARQIVCLHDMRPYYFPDSFLQSIYFKYILPMKLRGVDGVITVSEAAKSLISMQYKICADKIHVVPNSVDISRYVSGQRPSRIGEKPYILMVGATWPHKNAHELIRNHCLWSGDYILKVLSGEGRYKKRLMTLASKLGVKDKVEFLGYVSDAELVSLYQGASALVYPSLMEGFGIPPLEAMACGVPAIVSDIQVFREVYGDAPIYVQLGAEESWCAAFSKLRDHDYVSDKIRLGFLKVDEYTRERMCAALLQAIQRVWPDLRNL